MIGDLGDKLRRLRGEKHLTQETVARRIGISKASVAGYEAGTVTPSAEVLLALAHLYNVSSDYLLGLDNRNYINIDGLSTSQESLIRALVDQLKKVP